MRGGFAIVAAVVVVTAGCAATTPVQNTTAGTPSNNVTAFAPVDQVTLEPGENTTVMVSVRNAKEVHYRGVEAGDVAVPADLATVRPEPIRTAMTNPPYWMWNAVQPTVQITFSVSAEPGTDPGEYQFEVLAWNNTNHEHTVNTTVPVTVSSS